MSRWDRRIVVLTVYWEAEYGSESLAFHTCMMISVMLLGLLCILALLWKVPASVWLAMRAKPAPPVPGVVGRIAKDFGLNYWKNNIAEAEGAGNGSRS